MTLLGEQVRTSARRRRAPGTGVLLPRAARISRLFAGAPKRDDARLALLDAATMQGDPLADGLAVQLQGPDGSALRRQLDQALRHGIAAVAEPHPALVRLFVQLDREPAWLDRAQLALGARTLRRHGPDGMCALSAVALMTGYLSAGATKPIALTGALRDNALTRLAATSKFTHDIMQPAAMARFSAGFETTVRVRIMHAQVRRALSSSPRYSVERWGVPINQRDMLATHLQFTVSYMGGVRLLGRLDHREEREAVMHLWRYVSYLLGVREDLLPANLRQGLELAALINATEPGPDQDGRALAEALMQVWGRGSSAPGPWLVAQFMMGMSRLAMGDAADALGVPSTPFQYLPPLIALLRLPTELRQLVSSAARSKAAERGGRQVANHLKMLLAGRMPDHQPYAMAHA